MLDQCSSLEVIAANEGTALAMAAGHHLATGKIARCLVSNHQVDVAMASVDELRLVSTCRTRVLVTPSIRCCPCAVRRRCGSQKSLIQWK